MDLECRFLLGKYSVSSDTWTWKRLEQDATLNPTGGRVRYRKFKGLESAGKPKNVYTETYAEAPIARVYDTYSGGVRHETLSVDLDLVFLGTARTAAKDALVTFLESGEGITVWWDNIRQKCAILLFDQAVEPDEDVYVSTTPFLEYVFKFTSLTGVHPKVAVTWTDIDSIPTTAIETYAKPLIIKSLS
jgi:hypothetical protein